MAKRQIETSPYYFRKLYLPYVNWQLASEQLEVIEVLREEIRSDVDGVFLICKTINTETKERGEIMLKFSSMDCISFYVFFVLKSANPDAFKNIGGMFDLIRDSIPGLKTNYSKLVTILNNYNHVQSKSN